MLKRLSWDAAPGEVEREIAAYVEERQRFRYMVERDLTEIMRELRTELQQRAWLNEQLRNWGWRVTRIPGFAVGVR